LFFPVDCRRGQKYGQLSASCLTRKKHLKMHKFNQHDDLFIMHKAFKGAGPLFVQRETQKIHPRVSLIGIRDVFNSEIPLYRLFISLTCSTNFQGIDLITKFQFDRRCIWAICIAISVLLVIYYVTSRMELMLSKPTQVAVTLKHNSSLRLPDVTICPL